MNHFIAGFNGWSEQAWDFGFSMLWQSSALICLLFFLDRVFRKKVGANSLYLLWLLVLVKLLVPPTLALPTSAAWWLRPGLREAPHPTTVILTYGPRTELPPVLEPISPISAPIRPLLSWKAAGVLISATLSLALFGFAFKKGNQLRRYAQRASPAPSWLEKMAASARAELGLKRIIVLRIDPESSSQALFGLFRPIILLPQTLAKGLSPAQIRAILLHELLHLKRCDVWVHCAQTLLQIVYWWHPLLWAANRRIRAIREEAVDDSAVRALRTEADVYPPTLLKVAKLAVRRPFCGLGTVGILESRSVLRNRIERLLSNAAPSKEHSIVSCIAVMLFSAVALPMGQAPAKSSLESAAGSRTVKRDDFSSEERVKTYAPHLRMGDVAQASADGKGPIAGDDSDLESLGFSEVAHPAVLADKIPVLSDLPVLGKLFRIDSMDGRPPGTFSESMENGVFSKQNQINERQWYWYQKSSSNRIDSRNDRLPGSARVTRNFRVTRSAFEQLLRARGLLGSQNLETDFSAALQKFFSELASPDPSLGQRLQFYYTSGEGNLQVSGTTDQVDLISEVMQPAQAADSRSNDPAKTNAALASPPLTTRIVRVDLNVVEENMRRLGFIERKGSKKDLQSALEKYLSEAAGTNTPELNHFKFFLGGHEDMVVIRGTAQQLQSVQSAIEQISHHDPQVNIQAKFVELPFSDVTAETPETLVRAILPNEQFAKSDHGTMTLSNAEARRFLAALNKRRNANLKNEANVTTLSGRQTQMQMVETTNVVTGVETNAASSQELKSNLTYHSESVVCGSILDIVPFVSTNGWDVELSVAITDSEFIGYDAHRTNKTATFNNGQRLESVEPLPHFRIRSMELTPVRLVDGQTVIFRNTRAETSRDVNGQKVVGPDPKANPLFVILTVTVIDPSGAPIHSEKDLPPSR